MLENYVDASLHSAEVVDYKRVVKYKNKAHNETTSRLTLDSDDDWMHYAKCIGMTDLFFSIVAERPKLKKTREELAKSICRTCVVVDECLQYALANEDQGIWGGYTEEERFEKFGVAPYAPVNGRAFKKVKL